MTDIAVEIRHLADMIEDVEQLIVMIENSPGHECPHSPCPLCRHIGKLGPMLAEMRGIRQQMEVEILYDHGIQTFTRVYH